MASMREAFSNPSDAQSSFFIDQQVRFNEVEPNRFLSDKIKAPLGLQVTNTALTQFDKYDPYSETVSNKFSAAGISQVLQGQADTTEEETRCREFMGIQGVAQAISEQESEPNLPIRCGWRYKRSPGGGLPLVSQGALGTVNGPLNARRDPLGNGVQWFWNLKKVQDRHAKDYRRAIPATADGLRAAQAVIPNTAWCESSFTFISVDRNGNPLPGYACPRDKIVTNPANFRVPVRTAASSMATTNASALTNCMTRGVNPSLSRDCLLQAIKTNGCSSDGTLYQAIESAKPNASSYSTFLERQPSFLTYQSKQGANAITQDLFNKDRGTWERATQEIQKLQRATQNASDSSVRVAAQDLCLTSGLFDEYDFCADISTSAAIESVELKCMQGYWQEQNGKPAGLLYPSRKPVKTGLGTVRTWGDFRNAVDELKRKTESTNPIEQRTAINNFLGVSVTTVGFSPLNVDEVSEQILQARRAAPGMEGNPLQFWMDAMDGGTLSIDSANRVQQWEDKSRKGNTVIQNSVGSRPVYSRTGNPTIDFNGSSSVLPIPNADRLVRGSNFSVFVVERRRSAKGNNFFLGGTIGGRNNNLVLGYLTDTIVRFAFFDNDTDGNVPPFQGSNESVRLWCFEKTASGRNIYLNGVRVGGDSNTEVLNGWTGGAIGRFGVVFYEGSICEILIYNPGLSSSRPKIEGYLAHKWGLAGNLPWNHAYKARGP